MINAQDWLNQKFPTPQAKEKIIGLVVYPNVNNTGDQITTNATWQDRQGTTAWFYSTSLAGELDLRGFTNLAYLTLNQQAGITQVDLSDCVRLVNLNLHSNIKAWGLVEKWKEEIKQLKAQIKELEGTSYTTMPGSWEGASDSSEDLNTKIQRKKVELQTALTSGRKSTAPLRKEIELLEKVWGLEEQVNQLQVREANYQTQIQAKQQQITSLNTQLTNQTNQANSFTNSG